VRRRDDRYNTVLTLDLAKDPSDLLVASPAFKVNLEDDRGDLRDQSG
jgi:hypothetical protein